jgi:hypothetical protein
MPKNWNTYWFTSVTRNAQSKINCIHLKSPPIHAQPIVRSSSFPSLSNHMHRAKVITIDLIAISRRSQVFVMRLKCFPKRGMSFPGKKKHWKTIDILFRTPSIKGRRLKWAQGANGSDSVRGFSQASPRAQSNQVLQEYILFVANGVSGRFL